MKARNAVPLISAAILVGTTATMAAASTNPGPAVTMSGYEQVTPSTGAPGAEDLSVFFTPLTALPDGFWWRTITGHVGDCGPGVLTREHPGVIVGYGPGDMSSALYCPPDPWSNGTVNPS
jgi:hypothetical protein